MGSCSFPNSKTWKQHRFSQNWTTDRDFQGNKSTEQFQIVLFCTKMTSYFCRMIQVHSCTLSRRISWVHLLVLLGITICYYEKQNETEFIRLKMSSRQDIKMIYLSRIHFIPSNSFIDLKESNVSLEVRFRLSISGPKFIAQNFIIDIF